jgi:hypothetical protein
MSESFVNPTYYNLQKATIRFEFTDSQRDLDITALIPSISLNSSTNSETMHGTVRIIDSVGLLEETPLRGEEQIIFELADSKIINEAGGIQTGAVAEPFRFIGFIYKIDNVTIKDTNDGIYYDLHFISYQSYKAGTYNITRPFRDLTISEIAQTVFDDYFDNSSDAFSKATNRKSYDNKNLILEDTSGRTRCIIPSMRAEEAMEFLTKRAYSADESPSCTYRFFESSRGYHFVTDEHLFRLAEDVNTPDYDEARLFNFTYYDAIPNTLDFFDAQLNNLETIENTHRINSLDDLYNGAYRNKVIELDILRRQTNLLNDDGQYDYFQERDKYFNIGNNQKLQDKHTNKFIDASHRSLETNGRDEDIQKTFLVVVNYDKNGDNSSDANSLNSENYYADIISNRQAYEKHIESITVSAIGPGRLDITAGDIIDLDVKKFQQADGTNRGSPEQNKHLSGKYIVRSVNHRMEQDEMKNYYVMVKKDWSSIDLRNVTSDGIFVGEQ